MIVCPQAMLLEGKPQPPCGMGGGAADKILNSVERSGRSGLFGLEEQGVGASRGAGWSEFLWQPRPVSKAAFAVCRDLML